jgi:8-oxo-dGTP diphosphatase
MPRNLRAGVCVGAAIFRGDALLLLRRVPDFPGCWELPGGSVEEGEELTAALSREIREETGLTVNIGRPFFVSTFEADGQEERRVTVVAIEFLCSVSVDDAVRLSPAEHDLFAWVRREDLAAYRLVPGFVQVIPEAFRVYDGPTS